MVDVEVRWLGADDWRDLRQLRLRALAESPDAFGSSVAREQEYAEQVWRERSGNAVAAYVGGSPTALGSGLAGSAGTYAVTSMWTDPVWRGQRLGGRVLEMVVAEARARGLVPQLFVMLANPVAAGLYERHGFRRTGLIEDHGGRPAEEMRLQAEP